jgi:hypothetical protein
MRKMIVAGPVARMGKKKVINIVFKLESHKGRDQWKFLTRLGDNIKTDLREV